MLPRQAAALLVLWLAAAVVAAGSGAFGRAPAFILPLTIGGTTLLALAWLATAREGRRWAQALSPAALAWFHAWRLVPGVAFLLLYARGALPWAFAVPGGVGDIAVGLSAPVAAWWATRPGRPARVAYLFWNALGVFDLVSVVRAAFMATSTDPASIERLRHLPLALLPTFAVPLTFVAHALAFRRRRAA
jgi:hypothetical protein